MKVTITINGDTWEAKTDFVPPSGDIGEATRISMFNSLCKDVKDIVMESIKTGSFAKGNAQANAINAKIRYFEICGDGNQRICIKGIREPTPKEAKAFCGGVIKGEVYHVEEISEDKAQTFWDMSDADQCPIFGVDDSPYSKGRSEK